MKTMTLRKGNGSLENKKYPLLKSSDSAKKTCINYVEKVFFIIRGNLINLLHKNGIKCGVALFGETVFSLVTKDEKNKVKEILKQFNDGLIITSKIDNSGARLQ